MSLEHVAGTELVADGMTKQLTGQPLLNFKKALRLRESDEGAKNIDVKKMDLGGGSPDPRFLKVIGLMIVVASLVTRAEASETVKEEGSSEWWILVLITAAIAILGDRHPIQGRSSGSAEVVQAKGGAEGEIIVARCHPPD